MVARVATVAFNGIETIPVDVQVQVASGAPAFAVVGLPDNAVKESKERVRAALAAIGLSLPGRRITVNLAPADLAKEGAHFDLPIALGLLVAMGVVPGEFVERYVVLGELTLDARILAVPGVLLAAMAANAQTRGLVCPEACGGEAAWAGDARSFEIVAAPTLLALLNHFKGAQLLAVPQPRLALAQASGYDLKDVKGQETAKRALEVTAAGGHNLLMVGPPGAGKSMLARCLPGLLPELSSQEALEVSMVQSVAGLIEGGRISRQRPYRDPHHTASQVALIGGGANNKRKRSQTLEKLKDRNFRVKSVY